MQLPFQDRLAAGLLLANELSTRGFIKDAVVLALARGGVPVGFSVAGHLNLPLDTIVVRKLGVPSQPELAMGAIAGNVRFLDEVIIAEMGISEAEVEQIIAAQEAEMTRCGMLYRGGNQAPDLHGRTAILVDDGLATGSTMVAAVLYARTLGPGKIVIAVPVGTKEACDRLRSEVELVCLAVPRCFGSVGAWYRNFKQVSDSEVQSLLSENRRRMKHHPTSAICNAKLPTTG